MARTRFVRVLALMFASVAMLRSRVVAQEPDQLALAGRRPRFIAAGDPSGREVDLSQAVVLLRRVSLDLVGVPVDSALKAITRAAQLRISYSAALLPPAKRVTIRAQDLAVAAALTEVLIGTGLDVAVAENGRLAIVAAEGRVGLSQADSGAVVGRVTDKKTGAALAGATVVVDGTRRTATTTSDGRYHVAGLAAGTYTVRARYIGYSPGTASVTVTGSQEATADFTLEKSAQRLDEVVTTGTVVPTEVRALPTPVTVIDESDLEAQRPHTMAEIFRQTVPTAVTWDFASQPNQTAFSVRGVSSLDPGSGQMKVFVDGVPMASTTFASLDPNSIGRVEVIRGPQAAAIYGSDAVGGVIQVFSKRGDPSVTRPQLNGEAAVGLIQTPYAGYTSVLRQSYRASVSGGATGGSYNFGAGYIRTPDWVQPVSAQTSASVDGSAHLTRGLLTADVSGRYYKQDVPQTFNPDLVATGFSYVAKPFYQPNHYLGQTLGARLALVPTSWWRHTVTVGIDRMNADGSQTKPRLTSPADTFFTAYNSDQTKTSIGYNTSAAGLLARATTGSLTVGFDHYSLPVNLWYAGSALSTNLATGNFDQAFAQRTVTKNTGYFAQAQLAFRDALFLTGGLRAEENSNFGDSLGTPVSPQVGLTYVHPVGETTLKLRGSWGRAIRPPSPGQQLASAGPGYSNLANPQLAPERQRGGDIGMDAVFGTRGSLSVTYYNQTAENLIQTVQVAFTPVATYQTQNVGRVKNTGVELEGTLLVGPLQLKGVYGYVKSRIEDLGPIYTGSLQVGDTPLTTPSHTAGASLTVGPFGGTTVSAGLTYVGTWNSYDYTALYRCFGGTGPCQPGPGLRHYTVAYPGFVKVNATLSQRITPLVSGFMSVDNLTNNTAFEFYQVSPVMGRITTFGLQLHP